MVRKRVKEKGWDNKSWWKNKCHDRWSISCFIRINAWKEKGQWKISCRITTNLACRILHRPFHSIACSFPRFYKDCKCQHTSRQSEKWQGRERWSEDDLWAANAPQAQGAIRPAGRPHGTRPVFIEASLTCLFRKQHLFITAQNLHSELPLYSSEKERRAIVQGHRAAWRRRGAGRPRKAVAWLLLLSHSLWCGQGGRRGPSQPQGRSLGPHSHSGHTDWLHTLNYLCLHLYACVCECEQAQTASQGAKSSSLGVFSLQR